MRKIAPYAAALAAALLCGAAFSLTAETLVQTTPTLLARNANSTACYVQNNGPNPESCAVGPDIGDGGGPGYPDGGLVLDSTSGYKLAASGGTTPELRIPGTWSIYCKTVTAGQTHGAATIVQDIP